MTTDFPFPISLAVWAHVIGGAAALGAFLIQGLLFTDAVFPP